MIERVVAFYAGKPWHVRDYAHASLSRIKRPESEEGLLKLLGVELALAADPNYDDEGGPLVDQVLIDLTDLGSLAGLDESRRLIAEYPDDPELKDLRESLLATSLMTGITLPEEVDWRKGVEAERRRIAASLRSAAPMLRRLQELMKTTEKSRSIDKDESEEMGWLNPSYDPDRPSDEPTRPIRNESAKIGRNDPCPCGSGKKYKKCCGK